LRGQIISLAMWVARYSSEVLREGADLEPLIDVNRTMMEGLSLR
jgi:flagellar protein FlaF